jgi:hypothetical protein
MTADVIPIGRGYQLLRGPGVEAQRLDRIKVRRVAAFRRACALEYSKADQAMFGHVDRILIDGPGDDPRLNGRGHGPSTAS